MTLHLESAHNGGKVSVELDIDNGADDLSHSAIGRGRGSCSGSKSTALAGLKHGGLRMHRSGGLTLRVVQTATTGASDMRAPKEAPK